MPRHVSDDVARRPSGMPMSTATAVPLTEIWIVSNACRTISPRKSRESSGGKAPRANLATFASASPSTNRRGSTWASRSEKVTLAAKTAAKTQRKSDLLGEAGKRTAGTAEGACSTLEPLQLQLVVPVPGVDLREKLWGDRVRRQVEVDPAVADADDPWEVAERQLDAVEVHEQGLPRFAREVAEQRHERHGERRIHR